LKGQLRIDPAYDMDFHRPTGHGLPDPVDNLVNGNGKSTGLVFLFRIRADLAFPLADIGVIDVNISDPENFPPIFFLFNSQGLFSKVGKFARFEQLGYGFCGMHAN
jgi:hypothetical protein